MPGLGINQFVLLHCRNAAIIEAFLCFLYDIDDITKVLSTLQRPVVYTWSVLLLEVSSPRGPELYLDMSTPEGWAAPGHVHSYFYFFKDIYLQTTSNLVIKSTREKEKPRITNKQKYCLKMPSYLSEDQDLRGDIWSHRLK